MIGKKKKRKIILSYDIRFHGHLNDCTTKCDITGNGCIVYRSGKNIGTKINLKQNLIKTKAKLNFILDNLYKFVQF